MSEISLCLVVLFGQTGVVLMCSILYTEPSTVQEHSPSGHITGHQESAHFRKIH